LGAFLLTGPNSGLVYQGDQRGLEKLENQLFFLIWAGKSVLFSDREAGKESWNLNF